MHCIGCGIQTAARWCDDCRPEANESTAYLRAAVGLAALESIPTAGIVQAGRHATTLWEILNKTSGRVALGLWAQLEEWEIRP